MQLSEEEQMKEVVRILECYDKTFKELHKEFGFCEGHPFWTCPL